MDDINGRAVSIEMFLDVERLKSPVVRRTAYVDAMRQYGRGIFTNSWNVPSGHKSMATADPRYFGKA